MEIIIPTHHEIPRELVESSAVWKTVWKSLGIASGGGLWPEDDGEINNLTNNIGLWPQGEDDVESHSLLKSEMSKFAIPSSEQGGCQ